MIILTRLFFRKPGPSVVSLLLHSCIPHELSTFQLGIRDMCLSPIIPSIFIQTVAPAVIITVTKPINLVDFALEKYHFLS